MNDGLLDPIRHNIWATKELIAACRDLSEAQLASATTGTFGGILATFNHIVSSDASYLRRLSGTEAPSWMDDQNADLEQLYARVNETALVWERFLAAPIDPERLLILDDGEYEARAGVLIAQALNHGNVHREQICAILTSFGFEPPDLQGWAYGESTGRGYERNAEV